MENAMKKIFVGNLSWKTSEEQLKSHFEAYGQVVSAKIVTDKTTGRSKGFGFVEMADEAGATNAIRELNGKPLGDRDLRLSLAQERDPSERREREPRGDRGDRGDSYGGGRSNYRSGPSRDFR
jgi:RNA recognition motif-containing protein